MHQPKSTVKGLPRPEAQRNFVDPDSRIMESGGNYLQGYNCQAAVDEANQIIVAEALTNLASDNGALSPMICRVIENTGQIPKGITGDAGYWEPNAIEQCEKSGADLYISTRRRRHSETEQPPPGPSSKSELKARMDERLRSEKGAKLYPRRKATVEPVFGQIKEARGFRRFSLRGIVKAQGEWGLICIAHNICKLFKHAAAALATNAFAIA